MKRFFFLSIIFIGGCAFRTPRVNAPVANEVTVEADDDELRADAEEILRRTPKRAGTMHVKIVTIEEANGFTRALHQDGFAVFAAPVRLFGVTHERAKIAVDVITPEGETHACAEKDGSIYAPARKRALAVALDRALAQR